MFIVSIVWPWESAGQRWIWGESVRTADAFLTLSVIREVKVNIRSLEKVLLSIESKGRTVQTEGRKMLIKSQAELRETARECEQQIGNAYLPGHWASTPEQLLTLAHNTNRLGGPGTEYLGWQRSPYMFTLFPCLENWICILGRQGFPACVRGVCNVLDQTESSVAWVTALLHSSVSEECYRMTPYASFLCIHSSASCKSAVMSFH